MGVQANAKAIIENAEAIAYNKKTNRILMSVIILLVAYNAYLTYNQHTIEHCQAKLYTHLTSQKAPTHAELEAIPNPELYRELFTGCSDD